MESKLKLDGLDTPDFFEIIWTSDPCNVHYGYFGHIHVTIWNFRELDDELHWSTKTESGNDASPMRNTHMERFMYIQKGI